MKIGFIIDNITNNSTGIGNYAKQVVQGIKSYDKENDYFYIDFKNNIYNENLITINNPFKYIKTYSWHNYLPFKLEKYDLDYVLNFSGCPHFIPYKEKEVFFVYDISWYLYPKYHPKGRVYYHKLLFKRTLHNANQIVVDSLSTKNDLIKHFNIEENKISNIYPNFTDNVIQDNKDISFNFPFLLYIGTLEPRKNIITIIRAFHKLKNKYKIKHKLVLCGKKGWGYNKIFDEIQNLALTDSIIYKGYITDEQKKYMYQKADVFVYPSYYEGFGIPIIEAITYGCPVVTSNVSSLPEAVGDAGISINPNNTDELATAIYKIISNKKLQNALKANGPKQLQNISNKKQIIQLIQSF
jgi:glycosyltransferase involved in cell wall biosynthesis